MRAVRPGTASGPLGDLAAQGFSPAIHRGLNQTNLVAAIVHGKIIELYVNHQLITSINNGIYSHGQIGIVAYNQGGLATAAYSNARIWEL